MLRNFSDVEPGNTLMHLVSKADDHIVKVRRLQKEALSSQDKLIPIQTDIDSVVFRYYNDSGFLSKLYIALTQYTGPSDDQYDDFKGSFNFCFDIDVVRHQLTHRYVFQTFQYRSFIRNAFYQVVPLSDPRDKRLYAQPDSQFFSDQNIQSFGYCFYEKWIGCKITPFAFVKGSISDFVLYGFIGEHFKKKIANEEEFHRKMELLTKLAEKINDKEQLEDHAEVAKVLIDVLDDENIARTTSLSLAEIQALRSCVL